MILKINNNQNAVADKLLEKLRVDDMADYIERLCSPRRNSEMSLPETLNQRYRLECHQRNRCRTSTMEKRSKRTTSQHNDTTDDTADQSTTAALAAQQVAFQSTVDGQLKAFQACMQAGMESNNTRFDDFVRVTMSDISELKASLQFTQKELHELKLSVKVTNGGNTAADKLALVTRLLANKDFIATLADKLMLNGALDTVKQSVYGQLTQRCQPWKANGLFSIRTTMPVSDKMPAGDRKFDYLKYF